MGGFNYGGGKGDGTGWSRERGDGTTPGGGSHGTGGGANVGQGGTMTDTINGVTMIFEGVHALDPGSSIHWGGETGNGNNGDNGGGSPGKKSIRSIPSHPNVLDSHEYAGEDGTKRLFYSRVGKNIYGVSVTKEGNVEHSYLARGKNSGNNHSRNYDINQSKDQVRNYLKDEKDFLLEQSGIIADAGEKISNHIGGQYKRYADEIANNIRNFQGKTIRSYNDAIASLNNIMSNPSMKVKQGDKQALINAMKSVDANDMANRFSHFGKFFKAADIAIKIDKIREKSIEGYNTGNWGPLAYEVEAMVLSGVVGTVALGFVTAVLSLYALPTLLFSTLVIAFSVAIAYGTSFIDAGFAERFNNEVVRPVN